MNVKDIRNVNSELSQRLRPTILAITSLSHMDKYREINTATFIENESVQSLEDNNERM